MGLLDRMKTWRKPGNAVVPAAEERFAIDQWITDYLLPANQFNYGNTTYPFGFSTGLVADRTREISNTLPAYMAALRYCPPAFAAQLVRGMVLSQARFIFRTRSFNSNPRKLFGSRALATLDRPWPNGTTGELITRMEWHAGLAGNAYVTNWQPGRLRVLRPDWVVIVYGSQQEPEDAAFALDGDLLGYIYCNGGLLDKRNPLRFIDVNEMAHWAPLPDPEHAGLGMSWLTPAIREIQADRAMTDHKQHFFSNGATPSMIVSGITAPDRQRFEEIVDAIETKHSGVRNAYRTLYLTQGADAKVVGSDLHQMDFRNVQSLGETRIASLSRVHPTILGFSEGLTGSSLNAGNFAAARRLFADSWIYPTLQDLAASLSPIVAVPPDAELWFDTVDMPILREDALDAAKIEDVKAVTITKYVVEGFTPKSAVAAVNQRDVTLLEHSGLLSVQLQPPGGFDVNQMPPPGGEPAPAKPAPAVPAAPKPSPPKPAPPKPAKP